MPGTPWTSEATVHARHPLEVRSYSPCQAPLGLPRLQSMPGTPWTSQATVNARHPLDFRGYTVRARHPLTQAATFTSSRVLTSSLDYMIQ
ncbi:hypothetical protein NDU88_000540 [Pleurodeles waltl]|uniref:Uncharacterized protein n=1 Tax=Pleurodeles waltl TaxID=8319 RepID=A0AAV7V9C0_PLEWA|nr:hypothetical protein NDU88_000540 [Pleurodeles waltl]